jgi:hypothetical protein
VKHFFSFKSISYNLLTVASQAKTGLIYKENWDGPVRSLRQIFRGDKKILLFGGDVAIKNTEL